MSFQTVVDDLLRAEDLDDQIPRRRFEYADDTSYKFWTIELNGESLTMRFGKIGSHGQTREVSHPSADAAKRDYCKRVAEKTKSGYRERVPTKKKVVSVEDVWRSLEEHEPFIEAILDEPDEVAGYAIYADWLVEQEDPRGEFTQLQLSLEDPDLPLYKRPKLERAATQLSQKHARKWLGTLAPWLMDEGAASSLYSFFRGQLASISCQVLGLKFADQLRKSPHCRLLRELSIFSSEVLGETIEIDDQRFYAGRDYGVATLRGADFSNLREFRVGTTSEDSAMGPLVFTSTSQLIELIESMPRLEELHVRAVMDLSRLLQLEFAHLTTLHVIITPPEIRHLIQSGIISRLSTLGFMNEISDAMVRELVSAPGFDQLTEFSCSGICHFANETIELLEGTGVVINLNNFAP